jgi:hypothetical protein
VQRQREQKIPTDPKKPPKVHTISRSTPSKVAAKANLDTAILGWTYLESR